MARKSKNPIEVLRDAGVDVETLNLPPQTRANLEAFKKHLASEAEGYKKGLKDGKTSLPKRAAGTLLWNPVTRTALYAGLGTYGVLTGLKVANISPDWLKVGQLDNASQASADWIRRMSGMTPPTP